MAGTERTRLAGLFPEEIAELLAPLGAPRYRADQLFRWIHKQRARSFDEMTNLPIDLRSVLGGRFDVGAPELVALSDLDPDGARKFLYRGEGGAEFETVEIPAEDGPTVCVSSQSGCRYDCVFCATPLGGFLRSLRADEIVGQVLGTDRPAKRIVYMGMGEPLANYRAVVRSIRLLTHPEGAALPPRRVTVSTVGLVPLIDRLASEDLGVRLAVSLAAAEDEKRTRLMPIARRYPVGDLLAAAGRFAERSGAPVTFEIPLLAGVNDSDDDAGLLARRLAPLRCKVNLIPFNTVEGLPYRPPGEARIDRFLEILARRLTVTVRRSAGRRIDAACGQLRLRAGRPGKEGTR
ncbi:MAG: 23S rRNA (adenine(2503)-C(2))-methyltransferase RlmN [Candidatus Eisenbacteria bacterium]